MSTKRTRRSGGGGGAEVCPLADGQLAVRRLTGHSDLCLRRQRALSLFTLLLEEAAGAPPNLRLQHISAGNINELNAGCFPAGLG